MDPSRTSFEAYLKFLSEAPDDGTPTVLETPLALSLHFDALATQSIMSRHDPDKLVLGYTRTMMAFLLLQPAPTRISMIGLGGDHCSSIAIGIFRRQRLLPLKSIRQ